MTLEASLVNLESLAGEYPAAEQNQLHEIAAARAIKGERALLKLVALAGDLSADDVITAGLEPDMNPLVIQAIGRAEVSAEMASQSHILLNKVKGAYFELLVVEHLNAGETLGELHLEPGQRAELFDFEHPGADLQIFNADGSFDEVLQLKAVKTVTRIRKHFEEYPDIPVASTTEVHNTAESLLNEPILDTGIENSRITKAVTRQVEELTEDSFDSVADTAVEIALDAIPVASGILIVVSEGRAVLMGAAQLEDALRRGAKRLGKASAFTMAGAIMVAASVPGVVVTPALLASRLWVSRLGNRTTMGEIAKEHADTLVALTPQPTAD